MKHGIVLAGLACLVATTACTTAAPGVDEARFQKKTLELPGNGADCVFGSVRDFTVLDDDALLLYTSARNRAYYVEVVGVCPGLRSAFQLAFEDRDGRVCGYGMDKIVIPGGAFTETCPISRVHKLENGEITMVLEHYGRVKPRKRSAEDQETGADADEPESEAEKRP